MNIHAKLSKIQATLVANKGQFNKFGNYNYRSCEDIMQALKPHLLETGCTVTVSDEIVAVSHRIYVKATATFSDGENSISVSAFAREAENKKGMDDSQLTGATSSYARKYALAGLFAIDDNKDADYLNNNPSYVQQPAQQQVLDDERFRKACDAVQSGKFDKVKLLTEYALTDQQRQIVMEL